MITHQEVTYEKRVSDLSSALKKRKTQVPEIHNVILMIATIDVHSSWIEQKKRK